MDGPDPVRIPLRVKVLLFTFFLGAFAVIGQITIIGKQVYDLTGRELDLGLLGLAEFLPVAVLAPFTGSVADRLDRRKVLAVALVGEAVASILLFLYSRTDPTSITPIFAIVLFFGVARAFASPAGRALPIDLSPPEVVARVVAIKTVGFQAGMIAGFALEGHHDRRILGIDASGTLDQTIDQVTRIATATAERILVGRDLRDDEITVLAGYEGPAYGVPDEQTIEAIHLAARTEGMITDPVYEGKSMAGLIDLVRSGSIPPGSKVLYAHLGGQPALPAYAGAPGLG